MAQHKLHFKLLIGFIIVLNSFFGYAQNSIPGELLLQFKQNTVPSILIRNYQEQHAVSLTQIRCISEPLNIYLIHYENENIYLNKEIENWYQVPGISVIQKNHLVSMRETIPSDTLFDDLWHLKNDGSSGGMVDADIDATDAWDITTGGVTTHSDTIVVCIIESNGVDMNHPDLMNNHWKNYGEIPDDGLDNDGNGYIDDFNGWNVTNDDDNIGTGSHGTRVAGMVGAQGDNITGISGVNMNVKMMIIRGQNAASEASVIEAYTYPLIMRKRYNETNGAAGAFVVVTNASWGIDGGMPEDSPLWCAIYDSLGAVGILNIAATTNSNENVDDAGDLPTLCSSDFLIAVTMSNKVDERAGSGYGIINVDIAAPGSNVKLTTTGGAYTTTSGTSFASPCVAGAVALAYAAPCADFINLVKYDPSAATLKMREYILNSVDITTSLGSEVASGGRLNVKNAIDSLLNNCDPNSCIAPYNISNSFLTDSAVTLTWEGFDSNYIVYLQENGGGLSVINASGTFTLNIDTLKPCRYYTVTIKTDCGGGSLSNFSYPYVFKTDGCCDNPSLSLNSASENDLSIDWNAILYATSYNLRYRVIGESSWNELTDVSAPLLIDGLTLCTTYEMQIKTNCADSTQGFSNTYVFRTKGCGVCVEGDYCAVTGGIYNLEWLQKVKINDFEYESGVNNGWYVSPGIATAVEPGNTYPLVLTPGYSGTSFTERFTVWIDFNQNSAFEDAERVVIEEATTSTLNTDMTIPSSALLGITKMRIGMTAVDPPVVCPSDSFYGEYEDYCIYIGGYNNIDKTSTTEFIIYPNPSSAAFNIQFTNNKQRTIRVMDISGKLILVQATNQSLFGFDLSAFEKGVYFVEVTDGDGITGIKRIVKH